MFIDEKCCCVAIYADVVKPDGIWGVAEKELKAFQAACNEKAPNILDDLKDWIRQWEENFYTEYLEKYHQVWETGFDVLESVAEGDRISDIIESETGYRVARVYRKYEDCVQVDDALKGRWRPHYRSRYGR
ncbi:hypothetical protein GC425_02435 [Corynebacterium sp. zg254]|uniref:Uncharacterized protein n=1 Tax=Corynebacterium zhongnanshanii TaxID=2768834 RepID=A0ABQ6VFJ8_9CORY|nr:MULTISPECIES: hypothetical protein [Corynebacterium]KAB3523165.1 hypothetical protein F8377_03190 [Corynebacterium zhongnanshanii]MCR5913728.1 hypothetical protein [Corynebacterium sp. zg254]